MVELECNPSVTPPVTGIDTAGEDILETPTISRRNPEEGETSGLPGAAADPFLQAAAADQDNTPQSSGLQGLRQTLDERLGPPASSLPPLEAHLTPNPRIYPSIQDDNEDARIEEISETLECPVCLETADTEPIYQCPEGHLICQDCNAKLVDCPQCGHSLMNARNRTAESLAAKLRDLKGDKVGAIASTQTMSVAVDNPTKVGKGLFAYIRYRVSTRIGLAGPAESNYTVYRRFRDFVMLNDKLRETYGTQCIIVPPPPDKNKITSVWSKVSDLNNSGLDRVIALRSRELDRYMNRLARHPVIRKDPDFRTFLQEGKLAASLHVHKSFGRVLSEKVSGFSKTTNKLMVSDNDIWFKTRELHQKELRTQLTTLKNDIKTMSEEKMQLFVATTTFRRNLLELVAAGGSQRMSARSSKEREGNDLLKKVADLQNGMADLYLNQAEADDLLAFLALDYTRMLDSVEHCMDVRRQNLKELQKVTKKKTKMVDKMAELDDRQADFDKISQNLRRELEHFDLQMRDEFGETFTAYHQQYTNALLYGQNHQTDKQTN